MAVDAGEVLAVPVDRLRELVARDPAFGDLILRAYFLRRSILIGLGAGLRIVGSRYSPDTRRVRDFAARNRLPARWLDLETDPAAEAVLAQFGVTPQDTPVVIVHGRLLRNPSNAELAAAIGLPAPSAPQASCDMLVVGSGPAGLSAAVYGASEGMRVIVLDATATGGQAGTSSRIENYLGFPSGISGAELAERAVLQAQKFGARFAVPAEATSIEQDDGHYRCASATGPADAPWWSSPPASGTAGSTCRGGLLREDEHLLRGVAGGGAGVRGDPVAIVGGGNSAGQAAVFLSAHATRVTLIVREQTWASTCPATSSTRSRGSRTCMSCSAPRCGNCTARRRWRPSPSTDQRTGTRHGRRPGAVRLHRHGPVHRLARRAGRPRRPRIRPDRAEVRELGGAENGWQRSLLETSQPGIFAVGDVRAGSAKRVATAVGEGAMAIRLAFERMRPT